MKKAVCILKPHKLSLHKGTRFTRRSPNGGLQRHDLDEDFFNKHSQYFELIRWEEVKVEEVKNDVPQISEASSKASDIVEKIKRGRKKKVEGDAGTPSE